MRKSDQLLLQVALEKLAASGLVSKDGRVDKAMPTYAAALGPAIRTTGLVPTLAIYANDSAGDGDAAKEPLLLLITDILIDDRLTLLTPKQRTSLAETNNLFYWIIDKAQKPHQQRLQRQIETAVVAAKIALRTYEISKPK